MNQLIYKSLSVVLFLLGATIATHAQFCYDLSGCSDYSNYGYNSTSASTLEYDNFVSGYHGTVVRDIDGTFKIWGELSGYQGTVASSHLRPTSISPENYPGLTGVPLKVAIGSYSQHFDQTGASYDIQGVQYILLTSDSKLWVWGKRGIVLDQSLSTSTQFQQLALGLPDGVSAADVKMLFGTYHTLAITTCAGEVWVLSQHVNLRGNGAGASSSTQWHKVHKESGGELTGIVATRGARHALMALDKDGKLWTWGDRVFRGSGGVTSATSNVAVSMVLPNHVGAIKMIGAMGPTSDYNPGISNQISYFVLYEDGNLFALGDNSSGALGTVSVSDVIATWTQPAYQDVSPFQVMNNIQWISPGEHDAEVSAINVITKDKKIYNWGINSGSMLSRSGLYALPGQPMYFKPGYSNENIIAVETGGHTTMMLRECEDKFGYVGHRVNGSMGDGTVNGPTLDYDSEVTFATDAIQVCGAGTVDASITPDVLGDYYVGQIITLTTSPAGGALAIDNSAAYNGTATLSGNQLTLTGAGDVRVNYTVASSCGNDVTVNRIFSVQTPASTTVILSGSIWNDANGDALMAGSGEPMIANGLWAVLTNANGMVVGSAKVRDDGTFEFTLEQSSLYLAGDYKVILKNAGAIPGGIVTTADEPLNGYQFTGTNRGGFTGNTSENTGILNLGDISSTAGGTTLDPANFGIQRPPIADPKSFTLDNDAFNGTLPAGHNPVTGYHSIPMSSTAFTGIAGGGSLSGSDPEDCEISGTCNTGTGTTFIIESIDPNTRLYYNFGTASGPDIQEIVPGSNGRIENFDAGKMVIYGQNGSGEAGDELKFTYSIEDKAGAISAAVPYTITVGSALPVELIYFTALSEGSNAILNWATASESNSKGFGIERSIDSRQWQSIGFVESQAINGNSKATSQYKFTDPNSAVGIYYYRLKMIDNDGTFAYSRITSVRFTEASNTAFVYPNPATEYVQLNIASLASISLVEVLDANGTVIYKSGKLLREGISVGNFKNGIYLIKVNYKDGTQQTHKIVVNK
jgi:alpha-tubulin suppressor-like RCC1 family protein